MASRSGSPRRPHRDNKAGRGDGMSLPDAPHIFLAAALSPNSFFEFSADVAPRPKGSCYPPETPGRRSHPPPSRSSCAAAATS
ncbi:hypothetical protein MRX96_058495 [Rhipicephalus microplus]